MAELYIGLMAGTSADGIDAAIVDFSKSRPAVIATLYTPYSKVLRERVLALCERGDDEIHRMGELDVILGKEFAKTVNTMLEDNGIKPASIKAIGSHGQTIRHHPHAPHSFTLQIGDPNTIAAETGITVVADFRRKDIALGGQGAPLVPAFHERVFSSQKSNRAILNVGGIANITILTPKISGYILGFDTGPGNVLLDVWIKLHKNENYDKNGSWGSSGKLHPDLLAHMLADDYFHMPPPKSTGREYFNLGWLQKQLHTLKKQITPVDVQTTLVELTTKSIISSIRSHLQTGEILVCGGGVHNEFLMSRLQQLAQNDFTIVSTKKYGVDPDWVEAMAFAWIARQTLHRQPGNLPNVTGAKHAEVLGGIYYSV